LTGKNKVENISDPILKGYEEEILKKRGTIFVGIGTAILT
jgi:hypothetical protein